ncbi:MAG TPA: hypothetical protein PLS84_03285 [Salinivirgaceae bacterium]|nr:hypothetical protein [Salinivirgaceae bacterium]
MQNKIYVINVSLGTDLYKETSFRIPNQYKTIKGIFLFSPAKSMGSTLFGLNIDNQEVISNNFYATIIEFKGLLPISDVKFDLDIENNNQLFEIKLTRSALNESNQIAICFICKEQDE